MDFMQYWLAADLAQAVGAKAASGPRWAVAYSKGRAVDRTSAAAESAAARDPASPHNNQAAIFPSGSTASRASITQELVKETAVNSGVVGNINKIVASTYLISGLPKILKNAPSLAANKGILDVQWYQPKWQKNDYYRHNYRINLGDSVTVRYCSPKYGATEKESTDSLKTAVGVNLGVTPSAGGGFIQGIAG